MTRLATGAAIAFSLPLALAGYEVEAQQAALSGQATLGIRSVDVDGSMDKYREDINLDDGVRLFGFNLSYAPEDSGAVDRVDVDVANLGSDPFETIHLSAKKYGAYDFSLNRRRSEYFYRDVILPTALASVNGSTGGDFHTFDFARVHDSASANIHLSPETKILVGLDRYTRTGDSETTLDIQRDEFELDRPIDESMDALRLGVQHDWDKVTLTVEQHASDFENITRLTLPGASSGLNTNDLAELAFFRFDQAADYQSLAYIFQVLARPNDRLNINSVWRFENLDLDVDAAEESDGVDFLGQPYTTDISGLAGVGRDLALADVDLAFRVNDRLQLIGGIRRQELDQDGELAFGSDPGAGFWSITTTGTEGGIQFAVTSHLFVSGGLSRESRDAGSRSFLGDQTLGGDLETDRTGFFGRLNYRTPGGLGLTASIEDNDIDDAFTSASPTDSRRYRLRGRYRWHSGFALTADWRRDELANRQSGWDGDTKQTSVRASYDTGTLSLALGFGSIELTRDIEQLVTGGFRQDLYSIAYLAESDLWDLTTRWRFNQRYTVGFSYHGYQNAGSYPLDRDEIRAWVEIGLRDDYFLQVRYRSSDYDEDQFDGYEADSLEVALGFGW